MSKPADIFAANTARAQTAMARFTSATVPHLIAGERRFVQRIDERLRSDIGLEIGGIFDDNMRHGCPCAEPMPS